MTDEQLEFSVREVFQVFGNCYVKIRRDHKGMPYAFCQYEVSRLNKSEMTPLMYKDFRGCSAGYPSRSWNESQWA